MNSTESDNFVWRTRKSWNWSFLSCVYYCVKSIYIYLRTFHSRYWIILPIKCNTLQNNASILLNYFIYKIYSSHNNSSILQSKYNVNTVFFLNNHTNTIAMIANNILCNMKCQKRSWTFAEKIRLTIFCNLQQVSLKLHRSLCEIPKMVLYIYLI